MTDPGAPPPPPGPPPGWYPANGGMQWWDGNAWGEWRPPMPTAAMAPATTSAVIAHAGGIVGGFIVPLIVYLVTDRNDEFNRDQAAEALNFNLTLMLVWVVGFFAMIVVAVATLGLGLLAAIPLLFAVQIGSIVFMIIAAMAASRGERYRYPINIRFVKP